jgi:hypothetical protein
MAYDKKRVIDSVRTLLQEHSHNDHPAYVEDAVNHVYSQMLTEIFQHPHNQFEVYTKNYEVSISQDGDSERYYSDLPVAVVNLPRKGGGVISIQSEAGTGFRYYPVSEQEWRLTANNESVLYNRYWGWYLNRGRVWYTRMTALLAAAGVRMSLATQFKDFSTTDEVPLPAGKNYDLVQRTYDFIIQKKLLDDETDKQD